MHKNYPFCPTRPCGYKKLSKYRRKYHRGTLFHRTDMKSRQDVALSFVTIFCHQVPSIDAEDNGAKLIRLAHPSLFKRSTVCHGVCADNLTTKDWSHANNTLQVYR